MMMMMMPADLLANAMRPGEPNMFGGVVVQPNTSIVAHLPHV
jgi:hypothetical protein